MYHDVLKVFYRLFVTKGKPAQSWLHQLLKIEFLSVL